MRVGLVLLFLGALGAHCSSAPAAVCVPGDSTECPCIGAATGHQVCGPSGQYGACFCTPDDAGPGDAGAVDAGADVPAGG
ncbi:MAG: hypothetical protein JNK72_10615 [Myxococcales bacterium]|nr:hypothetical protein [Myxococcales bacterium]